MFSLNILIIRKGQATQIVYTVTVNNQLIDSTFSDLFNYSLILKTLGYQLNLCSPTYPIKNAFNYITPNKLCDFEINK